MGKILGLLLMVISIGLEASPTWVIIRHGESDHNVAKIYSTNPTHPNYIASHLTQNGQNSVRKMAQMLKEQGIGNESIVAVYASPLPRTEESAILLVEEGLFVKEKITLDERITDFQIGDLEGMHYQKLNHSVKEANHIEEHDVLVQRLQTFFSDVSKRHDNGTIVIITHGIISKYLKEMLGSDPVRLQAGEFEIIPPIK